MRQFPQLNPKMKLTPRRLKVAGWLAVASSFLTLPWFLFTYPLADRHDLVFTAAKAGMMIGRLTLLIYLFLVFQQLLTKRYAFTGANVTISLLIQASIVHTSAVMLGLAVPELAAAVTVFGLVMAVIIGVLHIMFGMWLLHLPASLGGMHRPYCYLNIVTGFALASVILLPLAMVTSTISDLMLGTIFLYATKSSPLTA